MTGRSGVAVLFLAALAGLLLFLGGAGSSTSGRARIYSTISGTVRLSVDADPARSFWAVLHRDGADEFKIERVRGGAPVRLEWREEVGHPRIWKLKFGPSRHPTYRLLLIADRGARPVLRRGDLDAFHDPDRALAMAYFAVPMDGERELAISVRKPEPLQVEVVDSEGAPLAGVEVLGIPTPRYRFEDGFDLESDDALQRAWPMVLREFEHPPEHPGPPIRTMPARTDARGRCTFEDFVGWIGIPEKNERFVSPRTILALPTFRSARFAVARKQAEIKLNAQGLADKGYAFSDRGVVVEGDWPVPPGFEKRPWTLRIPFVHGDQARFFTPCSELKIRPVSEVHRIASGEAIRGLKPGELRTQTLVLEEIPHLTIEGEVVLEDLPTAGREFCGVELFEAGGAGRRVHAMGFVEGPGIPRGGKVPFVFHVRAPGPYDIVVRTASYPMTAIRDVKAPRTGISLRLTPDRKDVPCRLTVRDAGGVEMGGWVAGVWPHRDLLNEFISGSAAAGKPGLNTLVIASETGSAIVRDVRFREGAPPELEATLTPGTTVRGRVVDREGRPVAGQWVHLSWPGYLRMPNAYRWLSDLTGPDGRFEIPRVPEGPWRLYARGTGVPIGGRFELPSKTDVWNAGDRVLPWGESAVRK